MEEKDHPVDSNTDETDHLVDSVLLNLPENVYSTPPQLLQHLFDRWLSLPSSTKLVKALTEYVEETKLTTLRTIPDNGGAVESKRVSGASASTSGTNIALEHKIPPSSSSTPLALPRDIKREVIPQFYFPRGRPPTSELKQDCLDKIDNAFNCKINGLDRNEFRHVTTEVCGLPFFLSSALFNKIVTDGSFRVTRDAFIKYWLNGNMLTLDKATQIFKILKQPDRDYLTQADFLTVLGDLCSFHPGLVILHGSPDVQQLYAATVLYSIFYYINRSGNDRITLRELKRGDLVAAMEHADREPNINRLRRYFSYEQALVIHRNFQELDADNTDMHIDKKQLARYNDYALTNKIVDRIFSQVPRKFKSKIDGKMCYEDFVYFILAEEDKQSEPSLEYWFKCIDLDGNGILTRDELEHFYQEQFERMEAEYDKKEDVIPFERTWTLLIDMIEGKGNGGLTLRDLKDSEYSGQFFNILFNLDKWMAPIKRKEEEKHLTEWEVFGRREYGRYCVEDAHNISSTAEGNSETHETHAEEEREA